MVNLSYNFFKKYKNFDIVPYQQVVDSYIETQTYIDNIKENQGGDNYKPINSDKEKIDKNGFWFGYSPAYYDFDPVGNGVVKVKADVVSMDMQGLNKRWDSFLYLELPKELFLTYQKGVHSNPDITLFKQFMEESISKNLTDEEIVILSEIYDNLYPEQLSLKNFFREYNSPAWRLDLNINQFISIKNQGLIYPICFNSTYGILSRGTHRAIMLAACGSDIPVFIQYPALNGDNLDFEWKIKLAERYGDNDMYFIPDNKEKKLTFYKNNEKISSFNSRS